MIKKILKYIKNILVSIDQLVNAILGGDPDETISSRLGKYRHKKYVYYIYKLVNFLFFWDNKHCESAIEADEGKDSIWK